MLNPDEDALSRLLADVSEFDEADIDSSLGEEETMDDLYRKHCDACDEFSEPMSYSRFCRAVEDEFNGI